MTLNWGGTRKLPFAFTEQGIYMLATVLKGEVAEQQSIFIMRAFREMRHSESINVYNYSSAFVLTATRSLSPKM